MPPVALVAKECTATGQPRLRRPSTSDNGEARPSQPPDSGAHRVCAIRRRHQDQALRVALRASLDPDPSMAPAGTCLGIPENRAHNAAPGDLTAPAPSGMHPTPMV